MKRKRRESAARGQGKLFNIGSSERRDPTWNYEAGPKCPKQGHGHYIMACHSCGKDTDSEWTRQLWIRIREDGFENVGR